MFSIIKKGHYNGSLSVAYESQIIN